MMMPPFMNCPFPSGGVACPMPRQDLAGLSAEELRRMEGDERRSIEARVQCLQDINTLLTAALTQMQQYTSLTDTQGPAASAYGLQYTNSFGRMQYMNSFGGMQYMASASRFPATSVAATVTSSSHGGNSAVNAGAMVGNIISSASTDATCSATAFITSAPQTNSTTVTNANGARITSAFSGGITVDDKETVPDLGLPARVQVFSSLVCQNNDKLSASDAGFCEQVEEAGRECSLGAVGGNTEEGAVGGECPPMDNDASIEKENTGLRHRRSDQL
jgi:hypothetical protein